MPNIRLWKSQKLTQQTKVYHDESIDNVGGLLKEGVRKAKIAHLLSPNNKEVEENYLMLLYRIEPVKALMEWSKQINVNTLGTENRVFILQRAMETIRSSKIKNIEKEVAARIAYNEALSLSKNKVWASSAQNKLMICEVLAETGNPSAALLKVNELLSAHPLHPESVFLKTRISIHLKESANIAEIGRELATLSSQRNKVGLEAIRHMTLLHLLNPLSMDSLEQCIMLLETNPESANIDFLRVRALQYINSSVLERKREIVSECAKLFNLNEESDLLVFTRWLVRLEAYKEILEYLPASSSSINEDLFKIRMNALAKLNMLEKMLEELSNSPVIPARWRMVVEARVHSLNGNFQDTKKTLDRLIPILANDPRSVRSVCNYLESSKDLSNLSYLLEKLIEEPIHQVFAVKKLLTLNSATADLEDLTNWISKLTKSEGSTHIQEQTLLYLKALDPSTDITSSQINEWIVEAKKLLNIEQSWQNKITLALLYLRDNSPDKALVTLGEPKDWRQWSKLRHAWRIIASEVYNANYETEKALLVSKGVDVEQIDQAEKNSLQKLFPGNKRE